MVIFIKNEEAVQCILQKYNSSTLLLLILFPVSVGRLGWRRPPDRPGRHSGQYAGMRGAGVALLPRSSQTIFIWSDQNPLGRWSGAAGSQSRAAQPVLVTRVIRHYASLLAQ